MLVVFLAYIIYIALQIPIEIVKGIVKVIKDANDEYSAKAAEEAAASLCRRGSRTDSKRLQMD